MGWGEGEGLLLGWAIASYVEGRGASSKRPHMLGGRDQ